MAKEKEHPGRAPGTLPDDARYSSSSSNGTPEPSKAAGGCTALPGAPSSDGNGADPVQHGNDADLTPLSAMEAMRRYKRVMDGDDAGEPLTSLSDEERARVEAWAAARTLARPPSGPTPDEFPHDEYEAWLERFSEYPGPYRHDDCGHDGDDHPRPSNGRKGGVR